MTGAATGTEWSGRIVRARELAGRHRDTAEILTFYAVLAEYQGSLAGRWAVDADALPAGESLASALDRDLVLDQVQPLLSWLEGTAPEGLADVIGGLHQLRRPDWHAQLERHLTHPAEVEIEEVPRIFVLEAILQPLAELLAIRCAPSQALRENRCPFCDSLPVVGVLREEGQGTRRTLLCGLCLFEWPFMRIVCPSCGERKFEALPVYSAEQVSGARVEGCDSCRTYLKTIDLANNGLAVPLVDDLATVTLDLWARGQGYSRLRPNLLRT